MLDSVRKRLRCRSRSHLDSPSPSPWIMEAGRTLVNVLSPALSAQLRALGSYYDSIPFELGLAGHCFFIASLFTQVHRDSWLRNLIVSFLGGFGGGSLVNILTGRPPAVFTLDILFLTYAVCWWLYMYCTPIRSVYALLPVKTSCRALSNWMRAVVICNAVDYSVKTYAPAIVTAPVILGTIGGCGGKLMVRSRASAKSKKKKKRRCREIYRSAGTKSVSTYARTHQ